MGYNDHFFKQELNEEQVARLNKQLEMQELTLELLIDHLLDANFQEQMQGCGSFLNLIVKVRFNLESINALFPLLFNDYRYKSGINLLFRSIVDDLINFAYLLGFVEMNNPVQVSLENELNIFHKEFLQAAIEGIEAEFEFQDLISSYQDKPAEPRPDYMQEIRAENPDLFDAEWEWKGNLDIRNSTLQVVKARLNQTDNRKKSFISESQKLNFIRNSNNETHSQLKALFKYFSQYQHYSPKAMALINHHMDYDITTYQYVLGNLLLSVNQLYHFIKFKDLTTLKANWERVSAIVFASFQR